MGYHAQVFKFHIIGWWTWNVVFCTCQTYAVVMNFTNVLNYKLWQRIYFFSLWIAYIHDTNSILGYWVIGMQVCDIFATFCVLIFEQMWVFCLSTWICTTYVPGEPSSQNMVPETLNLELWIVVSPHISIGNWTHFLHKIGKCCSLLGHLSCPGFVLFCFFHDFYLQCLHFHLSISNGFKIAFPFSKILLILQFKLWHFRFLEMSAELKWVHIYL